MIASCIQETDPKIGNLHPAKRPPVSLMAGLRRTASELNELNDPDEEAENHPDQQTNRSRPDEPVQPMPRQDGDNERHSHHADSRRPLEANRNRRPTFGKRQGELLVVLARSGLSVEANRVNDLRFST